MVRFGKEHKAQKGKILSVKIECARCGACCYNTIPVLTAHDIKRVTDRTGLSPQKFVQMYSQQQIHMECSDKGWVRMSNGMHLMGLTKKAGHCLFLSDKRKCTIYRFRPMACRAHPFDVEIDENNGLSLTVETEREPIKYSFEVKVDEESRVSTVSMEGRDSLDSVSCAAIARIVMSDNSKILNPRQKDREEAWYWKKCKKWNNQTMRRRTQMQFLKFLGL